jgi:predicted O-methyltransferase YrrM
LSRKEEEALFRFAYSVGRDRCIVELGSWFGRSAILLGGACKTGGGATVFAVDLFAAAGCAKELLEARAGVESQDFLPRFHANIRAAGVDACVVALRSETAAAAVAWSGPPVQFLFIDADHSYEGVRRDWESWLPRLSRSARVAFHDYGNADYQGVERFVNELLARNALRSVERYDSILCGEVAHEHAAC